LLTAEWIEYEIQQPGRPPQKIRRELFDLIGPEVRAKGAAVPITAWNDRQRLEVGGHLARPGSNPAQVCRFSSDYLSHLIAQAALGQPPAAGRILPQARRWRTCASAGLTPIPRTLYSLAWQRDRLGEFAGGYLLRPSQSSHSSCCTRCRRRSGIIVRGGFDIGL